MIPSSCCPLYQQHETPANPAGDCDGPRRSYTTPRDTIVEVDGELTRARVLDRREFVSEHQIPRDLSLYLEGF
jgi:hypothetical protein